MLAEPNPTAYDLRFDIMGFRVRISPFFFLMMAVFGYGVSNSNGYLMAALGYKTNFEPNYFPPALALLFWVAVGLLSILLHELGHSLVMRRYGVPSRIVLYHFGGLAIPEGASFGTRLYSQQQMAISAAGPGIQLALAASIIILLSAADYRIPGADFGLMRFLIPPPMSGEQLLPPAVGLIIFFTLQVNIYWALLNLIPIYPLDGGQISREMFLWFRVPDAVRKSLMVSVAASIMLVIYFLQVSQQPYLALMIGMLGFQSFMTLQRY